MSYAAEVLADSVTPNGERLITVQATFPRFILAEMNTHRVFSRNSASSRAIPPERIIADVEEDPFVPETFNSRVKGMGVGEELDPELQEDARQLWLGARTDAVDHARMLLEMGIDKSRINRLLEPFMWHTAIISSTEWQNFFCLRAPVGDEATIDFPAQLEFQKTAIAMRTAMRESTPKELAYEEWHLPLVFEGERDAVTHAADPFFWPKVSAGRCAKVSYLTHETDEHAHDSYRRSQGLEQNGHLSPFEHVATPDPLWREGDSNFYGWKQLRKFIINEANLVGALEERDYWTQEPPTS